MTRKRFVLSTAKIGDNCHIVCHEKDLQVYYQKHFQSTDEFVCLIELYSTSSLKIKFDNNFGRT